MADYPAPDWTRAEIEAWKYQQFEKRFGPAIDRALEGILGGAPKPPAVADRPVAERRRMCSSCGSTEGHRRGDKACPNYDTPARWTGERKAWKP